MRVFFGFVDIPTATTSVQLRNTSDKVKKIKFKARSTNTGRIYVGLSDVALGTNSWELKIPNATQPEPTTDWIDFGEGSVLMSVFYADASVSGDDVEYIAIFES